ncbi:MULTISPECIES: YfbM family protein [Neisseria]|uniref:YfbM family protein n=1 Tax=Neisseria TaxID=482 RepID=UPI001F33543C|nr:MULTISPECIES: YfbM family protein [Neisseria]
MAARRDTEHTAHPQSGIEQIKASSGTLAAVAECSAGKLWDALHFVLSGKGSDDADALQTR